MTLAQGGTAAERGKGDRGEDREQRKGGKRDSCKGRGERGWRQAGQEGSPLLLLTSHSGRTKEGEAVIDNYLDSICLISPKWHSITRELEILNYQCGISKGEPSKYTNAPAGCPGGTLVRQAAACSPGRGQAAGTLLGLWRTAGAPAVSSEPGAIAEQLCLNCGFIT